MYIYFFVMLSQSQAHPMPESLGLNRKLVEFTLLEQLNQHKISADTPPSFPPGASKLVSTVDKMHKILIDIHKL
jgi:hypothetical protein